MSAVHSQSLLHSSVAHLPCSPTHLSFTRRQTVMLSAILYTSSASRHISKALFKARLCPGLRQPLLGKVSNRRSVVNTISQMVALLCLARLGIQMTQVQRYICKCVCSVLGTLAHKSFIEKENQTYIRLGYQLVQCVARPLEIHCCVRKVFTGDFDESISPLVLLAHTGVLGRLWRPPWAGQQLELVDSRLVLEWEVVKRNHNNSLARNRVFLSLVMHRPHVQRRGRCWRHKWLPVSCLFVRNMPFHPNTGTHRQAWASRALLTAGNAKPDVALVE